MARITDTLSKVMEKVEAIQYADGDRHWYKNGKLHRAGDLPAIEYANGTRYWYKDGKRHRDGDLPAIERSNGIRSWYKNGVEYTPFWGTLGEVR